jgi:hypothetical protein
MRVIKDNFEVIFLHEFDGELESNEDVIIISNGKRYSATIFTIESIKKVMQNHKISGESNSGSYFYCSDILIVEDRSRQTIIKAIESIIDAGNEEFAFGLLK